MVKKGLYDFIVNPKTGRNVNVNGILGRKILRKYLQNGGLVGWAPPPPGFTQKQWDEKRFKMAQPKPAKASKKKITLSEEWSKFLFTRAQPKPEKASKGKIPKSAKAGK